jgi:hypothetical protein
MERTWVIGFDRLNSRWFDVCTISVDGFGCMFHQVLTSQQALFSTSIIRYDDERTIFSSVGMISWVQITLPLTFIVLFTTWYLYGSSIALRPLGLSTLHRWFVDDIIGFMRTMSRRKSRPTGRDEEKPMSTLRRPTRQFNIT